MEMTTGSNFETFYIAPVPKQFCVDNSSILSFVMIDEAIVKNRGSFGDEKTKSQIGVDSPVVVQ